MTATQEWKRMIEAEHSQSERMRANVPPPTDHWSASAQSFRADPTRIDDPLVDHLSGYLSPDQVLIDVGAGGGRLALSLARRCRRVVAVEPSPSMCRVLREVAEEYGIDNVRVVESGWLEAEVEMCDVALCAHVVYVVPEIEAFVRKLEAHAADRVVVVLFQHAPQSQFYPLWQGVHGEERQALPSLVEFEAVLTQLGIAPQIIALPTRTGPGFETVDAALEQVAGRLYVQPGTPQMARLASLLPDALEQFEGTYRIKGATLLAPHVVSWRPSAG